MEWNKERAYDIGSFLFDLYNILPFFEAYLWLIVPHLFKQELGPLTT